MALQDVVDPDVDGNEGQDMNHGATELTESAQVEHRGSPHLALLLPVFLLFVGMGLSVGCTTSSPGADSGPPAPDQGAANPAQALTSQESSQPDPAEGVPVTGQNTDPDSGGDETDAPPEALPEFETASGPDTENGTAPEPDSGNGTEPEPATVTQAECSATTSDIRSRMLDLINETRAIARNCGTQTFAATAPLVWNELLETAAAGHSLDMSSVNFFSHTGSNGSNIVARAEAVNYNYRNLGENLAAGQRTAADAMRGLVNSPGHCANLMNPAYREVGVACSEDSNADYTYYWTQVFGRRR